MKINNFLTLAIILFCGKLLAQELPGGPIGYMGDCQPVIGGSPDRHPDDNTFIYFDNSQKMHAVNTRDVKNVTENSASIELKSANASVKKSDFKMLKSNGRISGYLLSEMPSNNTLEATFVNNGAECVVKRETLRIGAKRFTVYDRDLCAKVRGGENFNNADMFERCKPLLEEVKSAVLEFNNKNQSARLAQITSHSQFAVSAINPSGPDLYSLIADCFERYKNSEEGQRKPIVVPTGSAKKQNAR